MTLSSIYLSLSDNLLSKIPSKSMHIVANGRNSFFFMVEKYFITRARACVCVCVCVCVCIVVKNLLANAGDVRNAGVWSLDGDDPLEEGMATHSSIFAWRIPWAEESGGL